MKPTSTSDEESVPLKGLNLMKAGMSMSSSSASSAPICSNHDGDKKVKKRKKEKRESKTVSKGKKMSKRSMKQEQLDREMVEKIRSEHPEVADNFIIKTMMERDPRKRRIKPAVDRIKETLAFDKEDEDDDSDFDPEDKKIKNQKDTDDSDDDDEDIDEESQDMDDDEEGDVSSDDEDYDFERDSKRKNKKSKDIGLAALFREDSSVAESSSQDNTQFNRRLDINPLEPLVTVGPSDIDRKKLMKILVCAVCCGDVSHESDEIVECDSCGISVHENCYGVGGDDSEDEETTIPSSQEADRDVRPVDLTLSTSGHHHHNRTPPGHPSIHNHTSPVLNHRTPPKGSPTKTSPKVTPPKSSPVKSQNKWTPSSGHNETASNASSASTEPWFCDPCKSGLDPASTNPSFEDSLICELCPNLGGIFKMTVTGRWVHVVCALYIPGVAFLDTVRLDGMTLFELPPERYGAKYCSICPDDRLGKTGVTISCDAGLCKTNFHVTCAQREGLLLEAKSWNETEMVDPFYAHCKLHSNPDKLNVKRKKKNFHGLMSKVRLLRNDLIQAAQGGDGTMNGSLLPSNGPSPVHGRMNERSWAKLQVARKKWYKRRQMYATKYNIWRPMSKVPRSLATSSLAVRTLIKKTAFFGASLVHDVDEFESEALKKPNQGQLLMKEALHRMNPDAATSSVFDLIPRKKMHSQPNFSPEFVNYYFDRTHRISEMSVKLSQLKATNEAMKRAETESRNRFEGVTKELEVLKNTAIRTRDKTRNIWNQLNRMLISHPMLVSPSSTPNKIILCSKKYYPKVLESPIKPSSVLPPVKPKARFSLLAANHHQTSGHHSRSHQNSQPCPSSQPAVLKSCGKCATTADQHLLALCDKCHLHYHLGCLDPPLTRMPKKTRFGGWQCSDCTEAQVELEAAEIANGSFDRRIDGAKAAAADVPDGLQRDSGEGARRLRKVPAKFAAPEGGTPTSSQSSSSPTGSKKGTPVLAESTTVSTVHPPGLLVDADGFKLTASGKKRGRPLGCKTGMGTKKNKPGKVTKKTKKRKEVDGDGGSDVIEVIKVSKAKKIKKEEIEEDKECCKCKVTSSVKVLVQCDGCKNFYHFPCLDPPLKKSPKARGYDWFCTDCDSSSEEDDDDDGDDNKGSSSSGSADSESDSSSSAGSESDDGDQDGGN